MSENQFHYDTKFTSVKVHHAPGGRSEICLGWGQEEIVPNRQLVRPKALIAPTPSQDVQGPVASNSNVHTSVKVRNPPGGQSSIFFG